MAKLTREEAEVRLGRAHELYAHAVRIGDRTAEEAARAEVEAAKQAVASSEPLPAAAVDQLNEDVRRLRDRLATDSEEPSKAGALTPRWGAPDIHTARTYSETEIAALAAALGAQTTPDVLARVAYAGRRAVVENGQVLLEALGEEFAADLSEVDARIAGTRVEQQRAEEASLPRFPAGTSLQRRVVMAGSAVGPWIAAVPLFVIAREGFDIYFSNSGASIAAAAGYAATVALAAATAGRLVAARGRQNLIIAAVVLLGAVTAAAVVATLSLHGANPSNPALAFILVSEMCVALQAAAAYVGVRYQRVVSEDYDEVEKLWEARRLHAELSEQRLTILRTHVARGSKIIAETRRLDALYVWESAHHAGEINDDLWERMQPLEPPEWFERARAELRATDFRVPRPQGVA
jgi:hypothetical protein